MLADRRLMTVGLVLGVLGLGAGAGLLIASVVVGVGTESGVFLSSVGGSLVSLFVVLTVVLSTLARRRPPAAD